MESLRLTSYIALSLLYVLLTSFCGSPSAFSSSLEVTIVAAEFMKLVSASIVALLAFERRHEDEVCI